MKDGPISKLTITETGHRPSQFKKISDALSLLCSNKNFQGLNEVLQTGRDLVTTNFMLPYPNATKWSTTHHVQVSIVIPTNQADRVTGKRPVRYQMMEQTHAFEENLKKELLSEYERNSKNKSQEYTKFLANNKALITIIFGQCNEATKTKVGLRVTYTVDRKEGNLINFINQLQTVCFSGDDGDLSYGPYKQVVAIKLLNTYTNNNPNDPHGSKEQVKIKFEATKAIVGRFPK